MQQLKFKIQKNLPISEKESELREAILNNPVVIVAGETGSGKSTQLPKLCLDLFQHEKGLIGHTQPRRLAARSIATRVAEEIGVPLGQEVGFKIRFNDKVSKSTRIKVMTDGILLAEVEHDPLLRKYKVIIIDEAHERSLNIDFLLGYLKRLVKKRKDLKVIITSATLDHEKFAEYFDDAPLIEVSGRTFPVEMRYLDNQDEDKSQAELVSMAAHECLTLGNGDILIFFATEREIRETVLFLNKVLRAGESNSDRSFRVRADEIEVLPLFGRLSSGEQQKIFQKGKKRRIILSTNVAETSVTVPNIHYVIDTGKARLSRYSYRSKIQRLPIEAISQASANQRAGRCGRIAPGVCFRLYAEADYNSRDEYTDPEILRTNLAAVILKMELLQLGHIEKFPFLNPPDSRFVKDGYRLLHEIGAMNLDSHLLPVGRLISRFPTDPRLARMLVTAHKKKVLRETLIVVSFLSVPDVRERPLEHQQAADEAHKKFWHGASDFLTVVNLWDRTRFKSSKLLRDFCKSNFVSFMRMREWNDIHTQLLELTRSLKWTANAYNPEEQYPKDLIHQSILSGLLSHIANIDENKKYMGSRHTEWHLHPGSCVFAQPPKWIMCYELTETHKTYARTVAKIDPNWLEHLAKHLTKKTYSEPHFRSKRQIQDAEGGEYETKSGEYDINKLEDEIKSSENNTKISAFMKVSLYGLEIIPSRKVNYGPINPKVSREIFIRDAIVSGAMESKCPFLVHNQKLAHDLEILEDKARRSDVLMDEQKLYAFYVDRIPATVFDGPSFKKWWSGAAVDELKPFFLTESDFIQRDLEKAEQFPDEWIYGAFIFPLSYNFEPGAEDDGVTVRIPQVALKQLPDHVFEWLVPGLLEEKIIALIRSLPKPKRRNFVPVPTIARSCLSALEGVSYSESLMDSIVQTLNNMGSVKVEVSEFDLNQLDSHLLMRVEVLDEKFEIISASREFEQVKDEHAVDIDIENAVQQDSWQCEGMKGWSFGDFPEEVKINLQGMEMTLYPSIEDKKDSVDLTLMDDQFKAMQVARQGVRRLFFFGVEKERGALRLNSKNLDALIKAYKPIGNNQVCREDFGLAVCEKLFGDKLPRTQTEFVSMLDLRSDFISVGDEVARQTAVLLTQFNDIEKRIKKTRVPLNLMENYQDIQSQLAYLCYPMFMSEVPVDKLRRIPLYLKGISVRLDRLEHNPAKDRDGMLGVAKEWGTYLESAYNAHDPNRWKLEEQRLTEFETGIKAFR